MLTCGTLHGPTHIADAPLHQLSCNAAKYSLRGGLHADVRRVDAHERAAAGAEDRRAPARHVVSVAVGETLPNCKTCRLVCNARKDHAGVACVRTGHVWGGKKANAPGHDPRPTAGSPLHALV